jgi:hypothetical protein
MSHDEMFCYCFGIKRAEVEVHFAKPGARLEDLIERTRITTKCTSCAVDLDNMLDGIQASDQRTKAREEELASAGSGLRERVDRTDSGFFLCNDQVRTSIRLANFPPPGQKEDLCSPHSYRVVLFDNDGSARARQRGSIGVSEELTIELAAMEGCPKEGWFLLTAHPVGPGRYGTLRPQTAFLGPHWAACYHTQFHTFASRSGRRSGAALRTIGGHTRTIISVINGGAQPSTYRATLEGPEGTEEISGSLAGHGACLLDVDASFERRPENAFVLFRIASEQPTRKNLIYKHPDGSLGFDHFPNLV